MKDIAKKSNTEYLLDKYHLQATKKYGQNFLIDLNTVKKIATLASLDQNTCVIEIGPGIGALTEQLSYLAGHVICYEIDTRLKDVLKESLEDCHNVEVIFQDFLTVNLKSVVATLKQTYQRVCVVANLPYYITSDILEKIITSQADLSSVHAMVQKEVALKLTDLSYKSPLTLMIESIGTISMDMIVSKNVFSPAPRIDSAIISIHKEKEYNEKLTQILKTSFTQKRKTIYNNLKPLFLEKTLEVLQKCELQQNMRPEQISIESYIELTKYL